MLIDIRGINEGRQSAREVDIYLQGNTRLPVTGGIVKQSAREILGTELPTIMTTGAV
jgi:glutamate synthase (NADPH/NADH)